MLRGLETVQATYPNKEIETLVQGIAAIGEGENSLMEIRRQELAMMRRAVAALGESRNTATWLADAVDRLVQSAGEATRTSGGAPTPAIKSAPASMANHAANSLHPD